MTSPSEAQSLRDAVKQEIEFTLSVPPRSWAGKCADALLAPTGPIGAHIAKIEVGRDIQTARADRANSIARSERVRAEEAHKLLDTAEAQVATLTARIADLEAALEPFAKAADEIAAAGLSYLPDGAHANMNLTVGHLRAARSVLSNKEPS